MRRLYRPSEKSKAAGDRQSVGLGCVPVGMSEQTMPSCLYYTVDCIG